MTKLNNKGQSLVMFILIIPILLFIFILVIDVGNAFLNKQRLDNITYLTMEYGLEHINENNLESKLVSMINFNDDKLNEISVEVNNNKIIIKIKKNINGIFAKNLKIISISSSYEGYINESEKIIERV